MPLFQRVTLCVNVVWSQMENAVTNCFFEKVSSFFHLQFIPLAPFLRRGWKAYYATLRDMVLDLHKNDHQPSTILIGDSNAIRLHHALAQEANDYRKRQHVFRLRTSDWAEYLFQTSDRDTMTKWIDAINLVAASFSSPPLPAAIDSVSIHFQRPLLPSVQTRYSVVRRVQLLFSNCKRPLLILVRTI